MKPKLEHSLKATVTDNSDATFVCVNINDIPHLKFNKKKYLGLQSWYESKVDFRIEIYLKGCTINLEYNSLEKWKDVLDVINSQV